MRVREALSPRRVSRPARPAKPRHKFIYDEEAVEGLNSFAIMMGKHDSVANTIAQIRMDVEDILDDELIPALEELLEHFFFNRGAHMMRQDDADKVHAAQLLLTRLRALREATIRDYIERVQGIL